MDYTITKDTICGGEALAYLANMIEGRLGTAHPEAVRVRGVLGSWTDEPEKTPTPEAQSGPEEASTRKRRR